MRTTLLIGPLAVSVDSPIDFPWTKEAFEFQSAALPEDAEAVHYTLHFTTDFQPVWGNVLYRDASMIVMDCDGLENRIHYLPGGREPFAITQRLNEAHTRITIHSGVTRALKWDRNLLGLLSLEHDGLKHCAFLLHASYIIVDGQAILFTAPSGGGKSTQADLWAAYANAQIINGDRAFLFRKGTQWFVSGFPVCGSSSYCLNRIAPLRSIIRLEKALANCAIRCHPLQALNYIHEQTFLNRWNKQDCIQLGDLLIDISQSVPVYHYRCTKGHEAVNYLRDILFPDIESR